MQFLLSQQKQPVYNSNLLFPIVDCIQYQTHLHVTIHLIVVFYKKQWATHWLSNNCGKYLKKNPGANRLHRYCKESNNIQTYNVIRARACQAAAAIWDRILPWWWLGQSQIFHNHEQRFATQIPFHQQVSTLIQAFQKIGNPFLLGFPELIKLDNRNWVDESVVIALYALEDRGTCIEQYQDFVKNVLEDCIWPIHNLIKKDSFAFLRGMRYLLWLNILF